MGWSPKSIGKSISHGASSIGHSISHSVSSVGHSIGGGFKKIGKIGNGHWGAIVGGLASMVTMNPGFFTMGYQADAATTEKHQMKKLNRQQAAENARQEAEARAAALAERTALVDAQRAQLAGSLDTYSLNRTGRRSGLKSATVGIGNGETLG